MACSLLSVRMVGQSREFTSTEMGEATEDSAADVEFKLGTFCCVEFCDVVEGEPLTP